jgi:Galactose oxidase, central domain
MARYLWTQREDIGPSPRAGHAMAYDSARSRTILFGGDALAGSFLNDTWEWSGEYWTQIADIGPGPRRDHALCFDTVRNVVLLFGGASAGAPYGDTWSWNGQDWTQLEDSGPSARAGHVMVFDSVRGRAVLFGGESATGLVNDTWEWDGQAWTQQEDTGPSPRKFHAMAFDLVHKNVALFGGDPGTNSAVGDTWSWDGSNWTQISNFGASPNMRAAMVSTDVQIAMFGGLDSVNATPSPTIFHETWVFDGKYWTHRQDIGPGPRWAHAMVFDAARRTIVLFGGLPIFTAPGDSKLSGRLLGDTWEHVETDAAPTPAPTDAAPTPAPTGSGPAVTELNLTPTFVASGGQVMAMITLDGVSTGSTEVELVWVTQDVFNAAASAGTGIPPNELNLLTVIGIPAGLSSGSGPFTAPTFTGSVVVLADAGSGAASAVLNIT